MGVGGGVGRGQKFSLRRLQAVGTHIGAHNCWSNGNTADIKFSVGGSNPGRLTFGSGGGGGVKFPLPGIEPPTTENRVDGITIWPLLDLSCRVSPLLGAASAADKKAMFCQKHMFCILQDCLYLFVCFCLTDCWPGSGTDWLTVNLSSPLLGAASATDKKPTFCQKHMFCIPVQDCLYLFVCFCLTDCWPGSGTDWLTANLSSRCTAEGNRISEDCPNRFFV